MSGNSFRMSRTRGIFAVIALVLVAIFAWHSRLGGGQAKAAKPPSAGISVDVAQPKRVDVPIYAEGLGTVQAFYTVTVTARVDGELEKVGFVEGQEVRKGDLLAQIDPRPYQATLEQALAAKDKDQAQLENAKLDLNRYETLAPQDLASKQTLDTQRALVAQIAAQIKNDQGAIDAAKTQVDYTTITSPINGRTGIRLVDPGNNVHASDTNGIVVVTQLQPISVILTLPEDALPHVTEAMARGPVSVSALARDSATELDRGSLLLVDNQIDQTTGTARLKAVFPNSRHLLWPGQFVNAKVMLQVQHDALTIPASALERGANGVFTYVVRPNSTVEVRPLKIANEGNDTVVVESGLKDGERVVTSNQYRLQPDVKVIVSGGKDPAPLSQGHPAS